MRKVRFTEEQIISILKQSEGGLPTKEICRQHGISHATFHAWRKKFRGMEVGDAKCLHPVEWVREWDEGEMSRSSTSLMAYRRFGRYVSLRTTSAA
jgi:transposase-like protein